MPLRRLAEGLLACRFVTAVPCVVAASLATAASPAQDAPPRRGIMAPPPASAPAAPKAADRAPLDPAWVGAWMGMASVKSPETGAVIEFPLTVVVRSAAEPPAVEIWSLPAGAQGKAATEVVADGRSLSFLIESRGEAVRFDATLAAGDASVAGTMTALEPQRRDADPKGILQAPLQMKRVDLVAEVPESRVFAGSLDVGAQTLPMRVALAEGPNGWCGSIDILAQGVRNFPIAVERSGAGFELQFPAGVVATMSLSAKEGEQTLAQMTALEGTFTQGAFRAPIRLELQPGVRAGSLPRPQQPQPPFPYESREASIAHPLGHSLAGTLTMPTARTLAREGRVPAVVLVSGSGPQDRDETLMEHKPFAVISDALTRAGMAVLRYDDRGTAKSTGTFAGATTVDLASDAEMAVEWLKRQPGVDPARIGLIGHSEGGLIGPIVAAWQNAGDAPTNPLAFLALVAPPAETGGQVLTRQSRDLAIASGVAPERVEPMAAAHAALMQEVAMRRTADAMRPAATALVREQLLLAGQPVPDEATLRLRADRTVQALMEPWMSEFIRLDPRAALSWLEVPTLAVWGTKDRQVDAAANSVIFRELAAAGAPIDIRLFEGLNHLLQPASTGTVEEYGEIELTIDPAALDAIVAWVVATAQAPAAKQVPESSRPETVRDAYVPPRLFYYREPAAATEPKSP